ncbi:MAG TPA: methyltransferase domain-containing protein [Rhodopila sp.]
MVDADSIRAFEHAGWEKAAGTYEGSFATATRQFIPGLLAAVGVGAGWSVLDVACGPGFVAAGAAALGARVRGLDFSAAMLGVARGLHPGIGFDEGDAEALPYPDGRFDAVVSNCGVHHVPRPIHALREAHRVLRPDGVVAFTIWGVPAENAAWKLVFDAIGRCGDLAASHAPAPGGGFGTPDDCAAALLEAGFGAVETRALTGVWRQADGRSLLEALASGTARMAALIASQPAEAVPAIVADIDREAARYGRDGGLDIPLAALVARGVKG